VGKSGWSLPDFSKRLREATFFVAFRSRGLSIARPPVVRIGALLLVPKNSEKRAMEQTAEISWPVFDLETNFTAASDATDGESQSHFLSIHTFVVGQASSS
jgi:hypothetical protein